MDAPTCSISQAAALAGVPRGTVSCWKSRGAVAEGDWTTADLCSLLLLSRLTKSGVELKPAAAVAQAVKDKWPDVALASPRRTLLLAKPDVGGRWTVALCSPAELPAFPADATVLVVDLHAIAAKVLAYVRGQK
jgi:hypothetical protein